MKKLLLATALLSVASMSFASGSISQEVNLGGDFSKSANSGKVSTVTKFDIENDFVKGNTELKEIELNFEKNEIKSFGFSNVKNDYTINAKISDKDTLFANLKTQKVDETVFNDYIYYILPLKVIDYGVDLGAESKFDGFNLKSAILGRTYSTEISPTLGAKLEVSTEINGVKIKGRTISIVSLEYGNVTFDGKLQAEAKLGIVTTKNSVQLGDIFSKNSNENSNNVRLIVKSENKINVLKNLDVNINGSLTYEHNIVLFGNVLDLILIPGVEYKDNFLNNKLEVNADGSIAVDYKNINEKNNIIILSPKASIMAGYKVTENVTPYVKLAGEYKFSKGLIKDSEALHTGDFTGTLGVKYAW